MGLRGLPDFLSALLIRIPDSSMLLTVVRTTFTEKSSVGELLINGNHECWTLEPPLLDPPIKPRAIQAGTYLISLRPSPRFRRVMPYVESVPDFAGILIHSGNQPQHTEGCLLVGKTKDTDWVGSSKKAFSDLFIKLSQEAPGSIQISYINGNK